MNRLIRTATLVNDEGATVRFSWFVNDILGQMPPVSVFEYDSAGKYADGGRLDRDFARIRWDRLISEGWIILKESSRTIR